jgi:hypothetical protein
VYRPCIAVYGKARANTRKNRVYGAEGEKVGRGPARRPFVPPSQKPGVPKARRPKSPASQRPANRPGASSTVPAFSPASKNEPRRPKRRRSPVPKTIGPNHTEVRSHKSLTQNYFYYILFYLKYKKERESLGNRRRLQRVRTRNPPPATSFPEKNPHIQLIADSCPTTLRPNDLQLHELSVDLLHNLQRPKKPAGQGLRGPVIARA